MEFIAHGISSTSREMLRLIIFLSFICPSYPTEQTPNICLTLNEVFWKITLPYLKNTKGAILSVKNSNIGFDEYIECLLYQNATAIIYNDYDGEYAGHSVHNIDEKENINYGYIFASDTINMIEEELERINVNYSKVIIVLIQHRPEVISNLLKDAWEKYNILNLIAILLNIYLSSSESSNALLHSEVQRHFNHTISAFLYNPFKMKTGTRGEVYMFPVNNRNATVMSRKLLKSIHERLLNVHRYPLRVGLFDFDGLAKAVTDNDDNVIRYELPDGEISNEVVKVANFTPVYISPLKGSMYGGLTPNGTFNGAIGLLENKEVDVTFNLRVLKDYGQKVSTFLPSISETTLTFIAPQIYKDSKASFFEIFKLETSFAITVVFLLIVITKHILEIFDQKYITPDETRKFDWIEDNIAVLGILVMVSQKKPKEFYKRCLFISIVYFSMVTCFFYQAKMVQLLTTRQDSCNLETLQDVVDSGLKILIPMGLRTFLPSADSSDVDPVYHKLYKRHTLITNYQESYKQVAYGRDSTFFSLRLFSETYQYLLYSNDTGNSLIHIVPEAPARTLLAYMVLKQSPFKDRIHDVMIRIRESGLYTKLLENNWYKMSLRFLKLPHREEKYLFNMDELWVIFTSFCICAVVSTIVFVLEFCYFWYYVPYLRSKNFSVLRGASTQILVIDE